MSLIKIEYCLFCDRTPTVNSVYIPVKRERMLFGKFEDVAHIKIQFGLCGVHQYYGQKDIRGRLVMLAEQGKLA